MFESLKLMTSALKNDQRGVTAVEYALVAGALVLGIGAAFTALTGSLQAFLAGIAF